MLFIKDLFSAILIFSSILSSYWLILQVYYFKTLRKSIDSGNSSSHPFFSIIVAIKDEDIETVKELVENLSSLDYDKYEVIIVSDDSEDYVERLKSTIDHVSDTIRLIRRENPKGKKAGALNYAIRVAKGEYLIFLDSEARVAKDFLKRISKYVGSSNAMAFKISIRNQNNFVEKVYSLISKYTMDSLFLGRYQKGLYIFPNGSAFAISKETLYKLGLWKEGIFTEDLEIGIRAHLNNVKITYLNDITISLLSPKNLYDLYYQIERWSYGSGELFFEAAKLIKKGIKGLEGFTYVIQWGIYSAFIFSLLVISCFQILLHISFITYLTAILIFSISLILYSQTFKLNEKNLHLVSFSVIWASLIGFAKGILRLKYHWRVTPKTSSNTKKPLILITLQYLLFLASFINLVFDEVLSSIILLALSLSLFILPD